MWVLIVKLTTYKSTNFNTNKYTQLNKLGILEKLYSQDFVDNFNFGSKKGGGSKDQYKGERKSKNTQIGPRGHDRPRGQKMLNIKNNTKY